MIFDAFMYAGEDDMLTCRMEAFLDAPADVRHVVTEARHTHRGVPKPLTFPARELADDPGWRYVTGSQEPDPDPWVNERQQRDAAWKVIDAEAADTDTVLICDLDEIPSPALLAFAAIWGEKGTGHPVSVPMKTTLFAVDWLVARPLPPTCVVAPVRFLRECARSGVYLSGVRKQRDDYMQFVNADDPGDKGGWHFSWVGSPERQARKLDAGTCHTEILATPEADLIRSGARWRSAQDGGGLPVVPVDADESWPAYVFERRCPASWFRPRTEKETPA